MEINFKNLEKVIAILKEPQREIFKNLKFQ
jgi:hypothetical protein